ncbi:MAG: hypothetical protein AAFR90_12905 [Pseudomonadota bacterium]
MTDQQQSNKPAYNIVKYYGEGRNRTSGRVGAAWISDKGHMTIVLENPLGPDKIILTAFPVDDANTETAQ